MSDEVTIDAMGMRCPLVVLTVKRKVKGLPEGTRIVVFADDKDAAMDLRAFAATTGRLFTTEGPNKFVLT